MASKELLPPPILLRQIEPAAENSGSSFEFLVRRLIETGYIQDSNNDASTAKSHLYEETRGTDGSISRTPIPPEPNGPTNTS